MEEVADGASNARAKDRRIALLLGWIDADRAMEEALVSIKRAGADLILTYAAADMAERL